MTGTTRPASREFARYVLVTGGGAVVDILVGGLLLHFDVLSVYAASAAGLVCGAVAAYLGHEFWTFRAVAGGRLGQPDQKLERIVIEIEMEI